MIEIVIGAVVGTITILAGLLGWTKKQRNKARKERDAYKRNVDQQSQRADDQADLSQAQQDARQKAKDHADKQTSTDTRPSGQFGDSRLSDND